MRAKGESGELPVLPDNDMVNLFADSMPINSLTTLLGKPGKCITEFLIEEYARLRD